MRDGLGFLTRKIFSSDIFYPIFSGETSHSFSYQVFSLSLWYNLFMALNLFFEGPVRSGKSTIIRRALLPYLENLGGFVVQRLLDENNAPVAYRLIGLETIHCLGAQGKSMFLAVDAPFASLTADDRKGIFLWTDPRRIRLQAFDSIAHEIVAESTDTSGSCNILLLDEIGGVDLLFPVFREAVMSVLQGSTPCIGVIKEIEKARDAQSYNRELRTLLTVHSFHSDNQSQVSDRIQLFLSSLKL